MRTSVKARNLDLSDRQRAQIERKLLRLERIMHPDAEVDVELTAKASHATDASHVAEVTLVSNGTVLRSTSAAATPIAALDLLLDKLERQVIRQRQRPRSVRERQADETTAVLAREAQGTIAAEEAPRGPGVVKQKRFDIEPMFEEDAIARMEELGHAFFVFLNAESNAICVVYRRRDGDYGVIEPVVGKR
ncbi:MAG TPA: ribosome-associated translation inhibitor RaiA [Candidatus Limnocylindria bacterium]|nr:ribosome-associated translation inhibitor RaiA [Candidatus Limnocylindria bacterium]